MEEDEEEEEEEEDEEEDTAVAKGPFGGLFGGIRARKPTDNGADGALPAGQSQADSKCAFSLLQ